MNGNNPWVTPGSPMREHYAGPSGDSRADAGELERALEEAGVNEHKHGSASGWLTNRVRALGKLLGGCTRA